MISDEHFNFFLRNGYIEGLKPGTSMNELLKLYGPDSWYVKHIENNGLVYGIIKMGITEFHIYDEKISGICHRTDLPHVASDYEGINPPWAIRIRKLALIEQKLTELNIGFTKHVVQGPLKAYKTAGTLWSYLDETAYIYLDTEGGVTFAFYYRGKRLLSDHIRKDYDIREPGQD
ncbi:MAG: hypothetical protein Roseis3KO_49100 [Roseivirga sp.]